MRKRMKKLETEQQINNALAWHEEELAAIRFPAKERMTLSLAKSIVLLRRAGVDPATIALSKNASK